MPYEMNRPVKKYPKVQSAKENLEQKGLSVNELPIAQDLSRKIMEFVKGNEHNEERQYRIENTKQFRYSLYGMLWSDVMDDVKKDKYTHRYSIDRLFRQIRQDTRHDLNRLFDIVVFIDHYFTRVGVKVGFEEDNSRTRWCSPHNIKRSNKVRDSYIKRDTKRRMKMITKR